MLWLELASVFIYLCNNSTFTFNSFFYFLIIHLFLYLFLYYFPSVFPLSYFHNIIFDIFNVISIYWEMYFLHLFLSVSVLHKTKNPQS